MVKLKAASGLRPPPEPPDGDAFDVAMFYVSYWEAEFARARQVVKSRASNVVVWVAVVSGLIAVIGAATAVTGWTWLGIVTAALAGAGGVLGAWDGLFRHRELWHQRSLVLGSLQALKRTTLVRARSGEERVALAAEVIGSLNSILSDDLAQWSDIRVRTQEPKGEAPALGSK